MNAPHAVSRAPQTHVALIVDHPMRDLEGLVLLACSLASRGVEATLVPMYRRHEVLLLRPTLVVMNYVRPANIGFIRACRRLGIGIAVLDTEGGILKDVDDFVRQVRPFLDAVDLYLTWGTVQAEALRRAGPPASMQLEVTGCPRYDFAVAPWSDAVRELDIARPMVLVNTNFPVVNPRFQSAEAEARELVEHVGFEESYVNGVVQQSRTARDEMVRLTEGLARAYPSATFVLRPHPFESADFYEGVFRELPNVRVIQEGPVVEWVKNATVLIHNNCSTSVEAFLLGPEPLFVRWIDAPLLEQPATVSVSRLVQSPEEMMELVGVALAGQQIPVAPDLEGRRDAVIEDWFFRRDGQSSARVADLLASRAGAGSANQPGWLNPLRALRASGWRRETVRLALELIPWAPGRALRARLLPEGAEAKRFTRAEVAAIVARLTSAAPDFASLAVHQAAADHARFGSEPASVTVSPRCHRP